MKKNFPKKAKLIADGGFYKTIDIENFTQVINFPVMRKITISTSEIYHEEPMKFLLKFQFYRVKGKYAEYKQFDSIKLD